VEPSDDLTDLQPKSSGGARTVMVLGFTLPAALGAGVLLGMYLFGAPRGGTAPVASVAKPPPSAAPSAAPPPTPLELAASGDYKMLDELKARAADQRTAEETLALARGRSHNKSAALEGFGKEIKKNADLVKDKNQLQRLRDFLNDRETTNQAAALIVDLPGTLGPDLLYDAANAKGHGETAQLADDLLATKEVRAKASPALTVALDLRKAEKCEEFKDLLSKAAEQGDRRAIPSLAKLTKKKGCGDNKQGDCFECLRPLEKDKEAIDLVDAIKAAQKRPAPKF
jgi:hypothetical protein